ncbi:MAG: winged helix-turn-helix transcriptional regulator [Eubacteriales bacterium]
MDEIRKYLAKNGECKTKDIAEHINLSIPRTRAIIAEMDDVLPNGTNTNRVYSLQK